MAKHKKQGIPPAFMRSAGEKTMERAKGKAPMKEMPKRHGKRGM